MRAGVGRRTVQRRRFSGRREVAIGLGVYALYLLASRRKRGEAGRLQAARNAERVVALERRLGLHVEPQLQELVLPYRRFLAVLNVAYVVSNAALTVGWLMRLYARPPSGVPPLPPRGRADHARPAQPVFYFFPCAPPRSLDHLVDTIADVSGFDLDSGPVAQLYDPLAAMPSIHVAYAVVTAAGVAAASESPALRALAPAYPPLVAAVVFVTANHYVLDAVAGAASPGSALRLARYATCGGPAEPRGARASPGSPPGARRRGGRRRRRTTPAFLARPPSGSPRRPAPAGGRGARRASRAGGPAGSPRCGRGRG